MTDAVSETVEAYKDWRYRPKVYVAGPLTNGGTADAGTIRENLNKAIVLAAELIGHGFAPLIPHFTWEIERCIELDPTLNTVPLHAWMEIDFAWLADADAIFRMSGSSLGASYEIKLARSRHIPVFHHITEMMGHFHIERSEYKQRKKRRESANNQKVPQNCSA